MPHQKEYHKSALSRLQSDVFGAAESASKAAEGQDIPQNMHAGQYSFCLYQSPSGGHTVHSLVLPQ